ncbi:GntR family transcriptional regulator [Streptomyces sp. NPDC051180]|uniref:GntR family transcriptional regulator n=1 Tax=Streptomyces sp. NPDC051180 TaxID=3155797 RepID=UPI00344FD476
MSEVSPRGTYLLIAEALRKGIEEGEWSGALPSEAELMQAYSVSRNTIRRALQTLQGANLISPVPGAGWHVTSEPILPLIDRVAQLITEDSLAVGDVFPSEAALCERLRASRSAVRRALAQMEGAGMLEAKHGKGRTVRALPASPERP